MTAARPSDIVDPIVTPRLELVSMSARFMRTLQERDLKSAGHELGATVSEWMADELQNFVRYRLGQLERDPSIREWLGRAMVLTDEDGERRAIGSVGFHGPPDAEGRVEVGYSVDPEHRRQRFAREAVKALFEWAHRTHGITRFVASVGPWNEASLNLIAQFGFEKVGEQMDEIDGLEYVFETTWPPAAD